jgi:uncharacterized protein (TIGR02300 family)
MARRSAWQPGLARRQSTSVFRSRTLVKAEWGVKRTCPKCSTRFYDLMIADPITCIACGNTWMPESILKSKQVLPFEAAKPAAAAATDVDLEAEDIDLDVEGEEPTANDDVDIGGDDDLSEVVTGEEPDET